MSKKKYSIKTKTMNKNDWKKIDTAPKDGTKILVCGEDVIYHYGRAIRFDYIKIASWKKKSSFWGGEIKEYFESDSGKILKNLTYWQHLPEIKTYKP